MAEVGEEGWIGPVAIDTNIHANSAIIAISPLADSTGQRMVEMSGYGFLEELK
jgi:hypothetical protein